MKRLELYVPQERLETINELLHKHNVGGITCYDITGRGLQYKKAEMLKGEQGDENDIQRRISEIFKTDKDLISQSVSQFGQFLITS